MLDFTHTKTVKEQTQTVKKTEIKFRYKIHLILTISIGLVTGSSVGIEHFSNSAEQVQESGLIVKLNEAMHGMAERYLTRRFPEPIAIEAKRHLVINNARRPKLPERLPADDSALWKNGGVGHAIGYKDTEEGRFYMLVFSFNRLGRQEPSWVYLET